MYQGFPLFLSYYRKITSAGNCTCLAQLTKYLSISICVSCKIAKISKIVRCVGKVLMEIILVVNIVKMFGCFRYSA